MKTETRGRKKKSGHIVRFVASKEVWEILKDATNKTAVIEHAILKEFSKKTVIFGSEELKYEPNQTIKKIK